MPHWTPQRKNPHQWWGLERYHTKALFPILQKEKNGDLLKCKFYSYAKTKAMTGDPTIPPAIAKAKTILQDIIHKTDGSTGLAHKFGEWDMSNKDELESERNDEGDGVAEPSGVILDFSQQTEGGTANSKDGIALINDYDDKRVGKASTAYDEVPMGTISSRLSSIRNLSEKINIKKQGND